MKKIKIIFFLVSFGFLLTPPSSAIDRETLWTKLNFAGSINQYIETKKVAKQNLGMVEEILFFSDMQRYNGSARFNSLQILKECSEDGLITKEKFFDTLLRLYDQVTSIAHPRRVQDTKNHIMGVLANFGDYEGFPLPHHLTGLISLANSLTNFGLIKNQGILNSLTQKISTAKEMIEKSVPNAKATAINKIEAAIKELDSQRGKQITEDGHKIISHYCKNLIEKIKKTVP